MKLLTLTLLLVCVASGQIKIGDITISDSLAKEYFFDCREYPDTIWFYSNGSGILMTDAYKEAQQNSIGHVYVWWEKSEKKKFSINDDCLKKGFIVPRKPSVLDYVKYVYRKRFISSRTTQPTDSLRR